jgi:hypothetical protein
MKSFFKTIKSLLGTKKEDNQATSEEAVLSEFYDPIPQRVGTDTTKEALSKEAALSESYNQIAQLVGAGNTKEALQLLTEWQGNEDYALQLLQKRFDSNEEQYKLKRIDFQEWRTTLARINQSLLQMLPKNDKKEGTVSLDDIHKLLNKDKIKEALNLLVQANYADVIMLQAGFNLAQKEFADKRITAKIWKSELERTIFAIMNTVGIDKRTVDKADAPLDLMETIRQYVVNAKLEKALDVLIQIGNEEAQLLKIRLLDAQQQAAMGKLNYSDFSVIHSKISESLLNIVEPPKPKEKPKSDDVKPPIEHILVDKTIVEALISNGKTENALVLLQKAGYPEATALYGTYNAKKRRLNLGMLQEPEWAMFQKELYEEILTWKYAKETTPDKILSATDKLHIQQLLQSNKTKEAVHFCKDFGHPFLLLAGQYTQIVNNSKMGLMTEADKKQELEDIKTAIERLIA